MNQYFSYFILLLFSCNRAEQYQKEISDIPEVSIIDNKDSTIKWAPHFEDSLLYPNPVYFLPEREGLGAVPFYYNRHFMNTK